MEATIVATKMVAGAIITLSGAVIIAGALNSQLLTAYWFGWMGVITYSLGVFTFTTGSYQANRLGSVSKR